MTTHQNQDRVLIFDTTLRDGEQAPGCSMNHREKLEVARQLSRLNVDVIEAGFPVSSPGDWDSVHAIAEQVGTAIVHANTPPPIIAGLARARELDITRAAEAVRPAMRPRIHTFIATSPIHMQHKLRMAPDRVLATAVEMVKLARSFVDDVEFSLEDAGRTEWAFMCEITAAVIEAGATTINIPDTVGYCQPEQYAAQIRHLREHTPGIARAIISTHCHDDLGLAVANSIAGVMAGARQVECTINGLGERAGNASLEEVVMNLKTRADFFKIDTRIHTHEIYRTSRLVSEMTSQRVPANKAVVGANAFAHESGIHQDGVLKHKATYEIMTPESVGWTGEGLVMGKHSGRHAFKTRVEALGYALSSEELDIAFAKFKDLCDRKKDIYEDDLIALVDDLLYKGAATWELVGYNVMSGTGATPTATVTLSFNGERRTSVAIADGPVDAAFKAIDQVVSHQGVRLIGFSLDAVTEGTDALGRVAVTIKRDGGREVRGRAVSTDIVLSSIKAYINALNSLHVQESAARTSRAEGAPMASV